MTRARPLLDKPAPSWKRDLPGPNQLPLRTPYPEVLPYAPNHVDDVYLELARSTLRTRGLMICLGIGMIVLILVFTWFFLYVMLIESSPLDLEFALAGPALIVFCVWSVAFSIREDLALPCDEPIRFNRARRKVYVYRFHKDWRRPFSKRTWGVRPVVYDWDDLHAEACSAYGPMGTGGLVERVTLAVLKPGTHEVLDRFIFAHSILEGEDYWAMAQLFMQQGPQALPTFPYPPRDWNNEEAVFNLARRFAPKVQWPAEMDLESRTAPEPETETVS